MAVTAEFQLRSRDLPLVDVAAVLPELEFQLVDDEQTQSGPVVFVVRTAGTSFDGLETALEESSYITDYSRISEVGSTRTYQIVLEGPYPSELDEISFQKSYIERLSIRADGWYLRQQFADHEEFSDYREFCRSIEIPLQLDRIYDSASTDVELIGLTSKQREALLAAKEAGYFAIPQQTTLEEVATTLGISRSAFAERLRRAQSHLIDHYVREDRY